MSAVKNFVNNNIVLIVGIPMILSVHWGWSKLQDVPHLVSPEEKKGVPIVEALKTFKRKLFDSEPVSSETNK